MSAVRPSLRLAVGTTHALLPLPGGDLLLATAEGALKRVGPDSVRWSEERAAPPKASLTLLPSGLVAVWGADPGLRLFDPDARELRRTLDHGRGWGDNGVHQVEALGEGVLLTCDSQGILRSWSLETGKSKELRREMRTPRLLGRFPDGRWALSGSQIHILSADAAKLERSFIAGATGVVASAFTADGALALANEFGKVSVWSAEGRKLGERDMGGYEAVSGLVATPDGGLLAWGEGGQLWALDAKAGLRFKLEGHRGLVERVALLDDGSAVSGGQDSELRLWDLDPDVEPSDRALGSLEGHSGPNEGLMALPGARVLSWSGAELRVWSGDPPKLLADLSGHKGEVQGAARVAGGGLVSWSADGELLRWPAQDGRPQRRARPQAAPKVTPPPPSRAPSPPRLAPKRASALQDRVAPPPAPPAPPVPELPPPAPRAKAPKVLRLPEPPPPPQAPPPPAPPRAIPPPSARPKTAKELHRELDRELSQLSTHEPSTALSGGQGQNLPTRYAVIGAVLGFLICMGPLGMILGGVIGWKVGKKQERGY